MAMQPFNPAYFGGACPTCGCPTGTWGGTYFGGQPGFGGYGYQPGFGMGGYGFQPGFGMGGYGYQPGFGMGGYGMGYGMPGFGVPGYGRTLAGAFGGVGSDDQIRDMVYESLDADSIIPYDADINVDVTGGVVSLTGTVPNKRIKHAAGDDAWWIPAVIDVNNNLEVSRARRGAEQPAQQRQTGTRGR